MLNLTYTGTKGTTSNNEIVKTYTYYVVQVYLTKYAFQRFTSDSKVTFEKLPFEVQGVKDDPKLKYIPESVIKAIFDKKMNIQISY